MAVVRFRKLKLSGFGPYRDTVVCKFTDGINTLVARNETGKSSLISGLAATIFGLPRKSNPEDFGTERFRNWHGPVRFEGEVQFQVEGAMYSIWREFDSSKISLSVFDNKKQRNLVSGEHNPQATKRNIEYEKWLKKLFGMASRELFEATFCVTQPLPETKTAKSTKKDWQGQKELHKDVQELLSGTGIAVSKAQDILFYDLKKQTKSTRERIFTRVDQRTDGELEAADARIADLSARLQEARGIADSLEVVRTKLDSLDKELSARSAELKGNRDSFNSLTEWRRLKSEYDQAVLDLSRMQKALRDAELYQKEIADEIDRLNRVYPEFADVQETIGPDWDALISLGEQLSAASERVLGIEALLRENEDKKKKYEATLSPLRDWGKLGRAPSPEVRSRRRIASSLVQDWKAFQGDIAEEARCQRILRGELALIDDADKDEDRKVLATYEVTLAQLEREKAGAKKRLADIEAEFQEYEANQREYSETYEDIAHLSPDAANTIAEKIQLTRFRDSIRGKSEELKNALTPPAWARIVIALVFAACGWGISRLALGALLPASGYGLSLWFSTAIAAIVGNVGWFTATHVWILGHSSLRQEESEVAASLAQSRSEIEEIDASLGDAIASLDEAELGRLQERLSQRNRANEELDEKRSALPKDEVREKAQDELMRIEGEYNGFLKRTEVFTECFGDIAAAYARWNNVISRKNEAAERGLEFARKHFGCEPHLVSTCMISSPTVSDEWQEVANLVGIAERREDIGSIGRLIELLESYDDLWWKSICDEAEAYEKLRRDEENLSAVISDQKKRLSEAEEELGRMEQLYKETSAPIENILNAAGGDPKLARKRWTDFRDITNALDKKKALLWKTFDDYGVSSLDELSLLVTKCQIAALGAEDRWQRLIHDNPGLPGREIADESEKVDAHVRSLDSKIRILEEEVEKLRDSYDDCKYELASLERDNPLNIAQAELELEAEKKRRENIELQADALTVAYLEVAEAVKDFHTSNRIRLEEAATNHFQTITGVPHRSITLDDKFQVGLDVAGKPCDIAQFSRGAQDQLYLALRLAIADLLSSDIRLPFIFDDPFVTCDSVRLEKIGVALSRLAGERQILLLSHNETLSDWGCPVKVYPD